MTTTINPHGFFSPMCAVYQDDTSEPQETTGSGGLATTKHTVGPDTRTVCIDNLWPACVYLVCVVPFSMLGEGARTKFQGVSFQFFVYFV